MLRQLFKKSLLYFLTLVGGKLLTAVFFIVLARILQPEKFGVITYFVTVIQLISVIADLGMKQWYQKKMAEKKRPLLLNQFLTWRLLFFDLTVIIVLAAQYYSGFFSATMLPALLIALLLEGLVSVADGYYLAQEKSLRLGWKLIGRNALLFSALFFIHQPEQYYFFFYAYNLALAGVVIFYFPWKALNWFWFFHGTKEEKITSALPYAAIDDLGIIYSKADSLLIEKLIGSASLGIYGAAYRYLDSFNLIPQALFHNLFPLAAKENGISAKQLRQMVVIMTALGILVAGAIFVLSDFLTTFLMGASYAPAAVILRYFSIVILLFFFNAPLNTVIQSSKKVKSYVPCLALVVALNISLNLYLLPKIGIMSAVYTMMVCEGSLIIINLLLAKKIYKAS